MADEGEFVLSEPYAPRPIRFLGVHAHAGYRIKVYSITCGSEPLDRGMYDACLAIALDDLPHPTVTQHRPGVGFAIFHQGRGWHYLVLSWWDNQNELPQRVWVRERDHPNATWRRAEPHQSICVWDLQVIWFEREMYVKHVLSRDAANIDAYIAEQFKSE
jgi:hypothetical protein